MSFVNLDSESKQTFWEMKQHLKSNSVKQEHKEDTY